MLYERILKAIDWFVPAQLRTDTGAFWRARIFAISHLLSPCFAVPIVVFLFRADPKPGVPFWIICALASSFLGLDPLLDMEMRLGEGTGAGADAAGFSCLRASSSSGLPGFAASCKA